MYESYQNTNTINKDEDLANYYKETINIDIKNKTINPIKKIEIKNNTDINYQTLRQNSSNYLKNLEMYKKLPDSIITNIIKSKKFICKNHNILFHHYSKEKKDNNKKHSGIIQSIIINANLKSCNKEKKIIKSFSNNSNSNVIYHKKNLIKANSALNTNRKIKTKKNHNVSQSTIMANYETNYDYDFDNNNTENLIYSNDNSDKFNSLIKKNNFTDVCLKEYLHNETKSLRTALKYFESTEENEEEPKEIQKNLNKNVRTIQLDLRRNSEFLSFSNTEKTEGNKFNIKNNKNRIYKGKYSYSNINRNLNNKKLRPKNKSQEHINSYSNRYKMKKIKFKSKLNTGRINYYHKILTNNKSYNHLSINGNFTSNNSKRKINIEEEEKNNVKRKKNNIFINTQNFYNVSKIDYISFRKNNLNNNNIKISKQNSKNILKHKEEKRIPFKLIKKDLNIITSTTKASLNNKKIDYKTKRNISLGGVSNKNENLIKDNTKTKIDKIQKSINNVVISSIIPNNNNKLNKKDNFKNKIENNKKKVFEFKYKEMKKVNQK